MRRLFPFLLALLALAAAVVAGLVAETQYETLVATTELVVPAAEIPPYTLLTSELLTTRVFPAPLAYEPVYHTVGDAVGKLTRVPLGAARPIYTDQAVPPAGFRYSDDPRLEVLSFPVSPEQAVGGQIKPGHHINLYRVVLATAPAGVGPQLLLQTSPAAAQVLARDVAVVDVRSSGGASVGPAPRTGSSGTGLTSAPSAPSDKPLTILTVAVPPAVAEQIVRLMGETHDKYLLWVSLTPPVDSAASQAAK